MFKSNCFCWKKFRKAFYFWKCAKYKVEFLHNQTIFVKNIFFSERVIIILCQKKKIFFFTHSHWQAGALQSLFIRQGVENSNLWGLLFMLSSSHCQQKKFFFCEFIILRGLLKKITDYFFYFALTFFTIVKKKIEIAEISAKNQIFTTRFIAENFSNKTCGEKLIFGRNFKNFNFFSTIVKKVSRKFKK